MKLKTMARYISLISQLGFTMLTPILFCVVVGSILDNQFHKSPLFTIIFILLGVGAAFRNLFLYIGREIKKEDKKEDEDE